MKTHVRILYAVAVAVLVTAGVALRSSNDDLAQKLAAASTSTATTTTTTTTTTTAPAVGSTP
jgi:hypothetical protein